ncbi:sensory box histidine kinase [Caballeronia temeraria]|uniref:Sensory box histidine kinase n=1 Tax=Caballeronia temeraria TaxID=1777137 RepID=A0A158ATC9_9BURK|nr:CHASE3 domain-containing protein [Caballeronia temeraria]SAK60999.1 sensory box histidine kinase [Caballeronia temeraria]
MIPRRTVKGHVRSFDWRVVPLVGLVIIAAATSFAYHRLLLAQRDWVEHTYQVMSALESTLQLMTDAETGQRGYILTGNKTYLTPYSQAVRDVQAFPSRLRTLVHDSPTQLVRVDALDRALAEKLSELSRTLVVYDEEGSAQAREMVLSNLGQEHMDRIRLLIAQMRQAENELLIERSGQAAQTEKRMLSVTIALAVLSIGTRVALYLLMSRRMR